jgi:glycine betaine/proline transport system permease protein
MRAIHEMKKLATGDRRQQIACRTRECPARVGIRLPSQALRSDLRSVRRSRTLSGDIPYSAPSILLGLNQTVMYAFSMLVIAALIGTTDLGQQIYLALGQGDVGLGIAAGASMAILALVADRLIQGFAARQRVALGL